METMEERKIRFVIKKKLQPERGKLEHSATSSNTTNLLLFL